MDVYTQTSVPNYMIEWSNLPQRHEFELHVDATVYMCCIVLRCIDVSMSLRACVHACVWGGHLSHLFRELVECMDAIFVMTSNLAQREIADEAIRARSKMENPTKGPAGAMQRFPIITIFLHELWCILGIQREIN